MKHYVKILTSENLSYSHLTLIISLIEKFSKIELFSEEHDGNAKAYTYYIGRSLNEHEMEIIVNKWFSINDLEVFFENTTSPSMVDEKTMLTMLDELAKFMHNEDVRKKVKLGWRYGMEFSISEKTSPMILPWEQLPEEYKTVRPELFSKVLEILSKSL